MKRSARTFAHPLVVIGNYSPVAKRQWHFARNGTQWPWTAGIIRYPSHSVHAKKQRCGVETNEQHKIITRLQGRYGTIQRGRSQAYPVFQCSLIKRPGG